MKLIHKATGKPVKCGDIVTHHGESFIVQSFAPPHRPESSGKISVIDTAPLDFEKHSREYYVTVFNLEWIDREDRNNS